MTVLSQILEANRQFADQLTSKYPEAIPVPSKVPTRQIAVFTCMDTRLVDFLEPALGIKREDAVVIKNAGNSLSSSFGVTIRSLLLSVYELGVKEILVIGHDDCGAAHAKPEEIKEKMLARGISSDAIKLIDDTFCQWLNAIVHPEEYVPQVVERIRTNPLFPADVPVHGLIFDPYTGNVRVVVDGYAK